jgi:hypothetical protein
MLRLIYKCFYLNRNANCDKIESPRDIIIKLTINFINNSTIPFENHELELEDELKLFLAMVFL